MRIAIISPWNPCPIDSGSRQRADLIIRGLSERHDVFVIHGLQQPTHGIPALDYSPRFVSQFLTFRWPRGEKLSALPRRFSLDVRPRDIQRMHAFIPNLSGPLATYKPDVILALEADGALIAAHQPTVNSYPIVVDQWEPSRIMDARLLTRLRSMLFWRATMRCAKDITVVTAAERAAARNVLGAKHTISIIGNEAIRDPEYTRRPIPRSILFCGNLDYPPNRDGILWFIHSVLPTIQKEMSGVELEIVGRGAPLVPNNLPIGVTQHGWVDDISSCYSNASLAINPVRSGHGSRVKNQCAVIHGVPLVTFPDGCFTSTNPGLHYINDMTDSEDAFADACLTFLRNPPELALPASVTAAETALVKAIENALMSVAGAGG
ncbi:MAG: glycosyltransferase family 4 protein [Armatimonadota bacterium]